MNDLTISNPPAPPDPKRNPSYPVKSHTAEGPHWRGLFDEWKKKVATATLRMNVLGSHPKRADFEYVAAQMQGCLDQIADSVRRLPGEVGEMYDEDRHKIDQAIASLGRLLKRWETLG